MDAPEGLKESIRDHIQAYIDGDVERVLSHMAPLWQDLETGLTYSKSALGRSLQQALQDAAWKTAAQQEAAPQDLFDLDHLHVQQLDAKQDAARAAELKFSPRDGDCWVTAQPAPGSPLTEPWIGVYRQKEGRWIMVAGD